MEIYRYIYIFFDIDFAFLFGIHLLYRLIKAKFISCVITNFYFSWLV